MSTDKQQREIESVIKELLEVIDMLMPGIRHIAIKDYAKVNEAPIRARQLLDKILAD